MGQDLGVFQGLFDPVPVKKKEAYNQNEEGQPKDNPYRFFRSRILISFSIIVFLYRHISIIEKKRGIRKMTEADLSISRLQEGIAEE